MKRLLGILLLASSTAAAHAASFDCAKAHTPQEKAICASPELSKADDGMAAAYKAAVAAAAPVEMSDLVRTDQREWLSMLPRYCPDPAPVGRNQTLNECLLGEYQPRIKALEQGLVQRKGGITFVWRTIIRTAPEKADDGAGTGMEMMPGYATLTASWPVAVSSSPDWQAWNKAILEAARQILQGDDGSGAGQPPPTAIGLQRGTRIIPISMSRSQLVSPSLASAHDRKARGGGRAHPSE